MRLLGRVMPRKAGVPCKRPGCVGIVRDGECSKCGASRYRTQDNRASANKRGYGSRWRRLRRMVLARQPLCVICEQHGRIEPAVDVHHIRAKRDGGLDTFENLQALCHSCHSKVTNAEMRERA
jgi:5-methylcytosine-specific restriction protein A